MTGDQQVFRSPVALVIWWGWLVFAAANLIDLAVQGRDHGALVVTFILLFVTGLVYVTAGRPRLAAGPAGLAIVNPLNSHRIGWAAVAGAEPAELLRVRCEWPDGDGPRRRSYYVWAVHSSRRRQLTAELRAQRRARREANGPGLFGAGVFAGGPGSASGPGGFGQPAAAPAPDPDPLRVDAARAVTVLTELAAQARRDEPAAVALAPESCWSWPALAAVAVPGLALLLLALL